MKYLIHQIVMRILTAGQAHIKGKIQAVSCVCCLLLTPLTLFWVNQAAAWELGGGLGYESRYISEGVNSLDHGGIAILELELEHETGIGDFALAIEFLTGTSVNFHEGELSLGYEKALGDFTGALSYVRIREEEGDETEYDNEWVVGFSYDSWEHVTPSVEYVYSTEANGGLLVLMIEGEVEVFGQPLGPYLLADIDYDYVSEDYDGLNHIEAGVAWETSLLDIDMTVNAAYSMAQENLRRDDEDGDYFWVGVNFSL